MSTEEPEPLSAEERVLEQMLRERLGAEAPPDLTARILTAARRSSGPRAAGVQAGARRAPFRLGLLAGAAAAALVASIWWSGRAEPARFVPLQVMRGAITWSGDAGNLRLAAPQERALALRARDRLLTAGAGDAHVRIAGLGTLRMLEPTELEVLQMEWKDFGTGATVGAITVGVIAGAIFWTTGAFEQTARAGQSLELRGEEPGAMRGQLAAEDRLRQLEGELGDVRAENDRLRASAARVAAEEQAQKPLEPAPVKAGATADEPQAPGIAFFGYDDVLAKIDWAVTGKAMKEMTALTVRLVEEMEKTGEMPLDILADIQKLNADLIRQAQILTEGDVPGSTINSKFTHPAVAANQIDATLKAANVPLTDAQRDSLRALAARYAAQDEQRRTGEHAEMSALEKACAELSLRADFYAESERLLGRDQLGVLWNDKTRGKLTMDIFGAGLGWAERIDPTPAADPGALANQMGDKLRRSLDCTDAQMQLLRPLLDAHASSLPGELWGEGKGMMAAFSMRSASIGELARRQVELVRQILQRVDLTPEQRQKLLRMGRVAVPTRE